MADWCHAPDAARFGPRHRGTDRHDARRLHERHRWDQVRAHVDPASWSINVLGDARRRIRAELQPGQRCRSSCPVAGRARRSRAADQSQVPSAGDRPVRRRQWTAATIREDWSLLQARHQVRAHRPGPVCQPATHRVGCAGYAQPDSGGQQLRQPKRRRMAGPRGRVLDRSPGLRADHCQSRRQAAAGAHRRRKGLPRPATAARTESELATHRRRPAGPVTNTPPVRPYIELMAPPSIGIIAPVM
jgi:hypothetical protein